MKRGRDKGPEDQKAPIATNEPTREQARSSDLVVRLLSDPLRGMTAQRIQEQLSAANDNHGVKIETSPSPSSIERQCIPSAIERSEIPRYFRQFQNAAVLKKLAHAGKGPLYQLIGKKAWYETADILAWLGSRKRSGPERGPDAGKTHEPSPLQEQRGPGKKRRGRPTKAALWRQEQARRSDP